MLAILKDFVDMANKDHFRPRQARDMISRLKAPHRIGLVVRDIKEDA